MSRKFMVILQQFASTSLTFEIRMCCMQDMYDFIRNHIVKD